MRVLTVFALFILMVGLIACSGGEQPEPEAPVDQDPSLPGADADAEEDLSEIEQELNELEGLEDDLSMDDLGEFDLELE